MSDALPGVPTGDSRGPQGPPRCANPRTCSIHGPLGNEDGDEDGDEDYAGYRHPPRHWTPKAIREEIAR